MNDPDTDIRAELDGLILERLRELVRTRDPVPPDLIDVVYALIGPADDGVPDARRD